MAPRSKDKAVPYIVDFTMADTDKDGMSTMHWVAAEGGRP
jgi:hypothetical protein